MIDITDDITDELSATAARRPRRWTPTLDESGRSAKRSKFGGTKYVYPAPLMREMRAWFDSAVVAALPQARILYWT